MTWIGIMATPLEGPALGEPALRFFLQEWSADFKIRPANYGTVQFGTMHGLLTLESSGAYRSKAKSHDQQNTSKKQQTKKKRRLFLGIQFAFQSLPPKSDKIG
jgi:hypothetical protein